MTMRLTIKPEQETPVQATLDRTVAITKLTPGIGAEIHGVDLSRELSPETLESVKQALWENQVFFLRDQHLTPLQHLEFGRRFGPLHVHALKRSRHPEHEEILLIHGDAQSKYVPGEDWHTDVSCDASPPSLSMLYIMQVPPCGGDTLWSSMYAAYEALSPAMQSFLEGLTAIHDGAKPWLNKYGVTPDVAYARTEHPVVTVHPETGRKLLFVNRGFTTRIAQLTEHESDALLRMLFEHVAHPLYQCRFRWEANSLAIWDNRCTQHHAMWDYFPHVRHGHRVTVIGTPPRAADQARIQATTALG